MFNFFKRKGGKAEGAGTPETTRRQPTGDITKTPSVESHTPRNENDITNEKTGTLRKDVVNLLLPDTDYNQKTGVGALLQIMAGKRKKNRRKGRTDSCRVSPPKETPNLKRCNSNLERCEREAEPAHDDVPPTPAKNTRDAAHAPDDPADFVKALVLQKYANKPPETKQQHVSLVYVSNEPDLDEKRHTEALLREIARSIDCTIDKINEKEQMGANDSKPHERPREPVYETVQDKAISSYKNDLKGELHKLLQTEDESGSTPERDNRVDRLDTESLESTAFTKKSNLKPPRSDNEGCSDDDRSDNGKKRVTFRKHIVFDDGEQQTDEEVDSSFESLTSEEEEAEYLEDAMPDNDEMLGGFVVSRTDENKTVINVNEVENEPIQIKIECVDDDGLKRISSDNSDSGFIEFSDRQESGDEATNVKSIVEGSASDVSESESEEEIIEEIVEEVEEEAEIEEIEEIEEEDEEEVAEESEGEFVDAAKADTKTLVTNEGKFQSQVAALTELADSRCDEAERARELVAACRKDIEAKDLEIQQLKCELAAAFKESELVRQRSRSLEEELAAARSCSADLADQLRTRNDEAIRQLRAELEDALNRRLELESRVEALERDKARLEQEKLIQEQKAQEALTAAEANTAKWRAAHESARSQAAARAERMLADCEWKMRELEKRARDAERDNKELTATVEQLKTAPPTPSHVAELQQLRGLVSEQQRSVESLTLQLQRVETREEALKLEVHRLKDLLEKDAQILKDKEEQHLEDIHRLQQQHSDDVAALKAEHAGAMADAAATRSAMERAHAERTRTALANLRAEAERDARNAERKLREVTTRYENLKEELASKEAQFEHALVEAHSKADWDVMQLRHLLDKADIAYANKVEQLNERFEQERESLTKEWSDKVRSVEEEAAAAADEAKKLLEATRARLVAEKLDQVNKLKDKHRQEMDEQWELFMADKEACLARMKSECRQEGEEERVKREKELLEEIAELKSQIHSKSTDYDGLAVRAAACGRTLAVTEQELSVRWVCALAAGCVCVCAGSLRLALGTFLLSLALLFYIKMRSNRLNKKIEKIEKEALERERLLREKNSEDAAKIKQVERASRDQIEHLGRKCACLRKLFDDMRARLAARERAAETEARAREKELHQLRAEVARLTKILVEQSSPKLGARTRADGCENALKTEESKPVAAEAPPSAPRRKGGTLRTPELARKRPTLPELQPLPPEARRPLTEFENGRRRAGSVDLPAVQVPVRIKQLEEKTKE